MLTPMGLCSVYMASFKTAVPISGGALCVFCFRRARPCSLLCLPSQIIIALILLGVNFLQFGSNGGPQIALQKAAGALL